MNPFSSLLVPKSLQCGHTFCSVCVESLARKKFCPFCAKPISSELISVNYALLERVAFNEIFCTKHGNLIATHFSINTVTAYCLECAANTSGLDLIEASFEEIGNVLMRKSFEFEFNNRLDDVTKAKLARLTSVCNNEKFKLLHSVIQENEGVKCLNHLKPAIFFNFQNAQALCPDCHMTGGEVSLGSKEFKDLIDSEIRKIAFFVDSVKISKDFKDCLKRLDRLRISEKIRVLKEMIVKKGLDRVDVVPGSCNECHQEFSLPGNLPVRLNCLGAHFVCEICRRMIKKCPIDYSDLHSTDGNKALLKLPLCQVCCEVLDSESLPLLQTCGAVTCMKCSNRPCPFCSITHENSSTISKFFIQLGDQHLLKCFRDTKTAKYFSTQDNNPYCQACRSSLYNLPMQSLKDFDISSYLITECQRLSDRLGSRKTPVILNSLNSLNTSSNWQRLELLRLLSSLITAANPLHSRATPGFSVPVFSGRVKFMQRFNSILPNPAHGSGNSKPWFIKRSENQVEVLTFSCSRIVSLVGVTVTCPVQGVNGILEYLEVLYNEKRVASCVNQQVLCGIVQDIFFQHPVQISANTRYDLLFKIDADFVYKGNPLDRTSCEGSDSTIFEIFECKMKGIVTNGQGHLSGPLIRLLYT
jgi:hypothetical protein